MRRFTKADLIPQAWKRRIDAILADELLGANRYFAQTNPSLQRLIAIATDMAPETYLRSLRQRWSWHNDFYENALEPAIHLMTEESSFALSPLQVQALHRTYPVMSLVDQATLVLSAGIKQHIDKWTQRPETGLRDEAERQLLLTLPQETFFATYAIDHLEYIIACRVNSPRRNALKEQLFAKYHAGDEEIFAGRMEKFSWCRGFSLRQLRESRARLRADPNRAIHHFYLTLERPRLKALRDIIVFDNVTEYEIAKSLIGISGFLLRKRVLQYLGETKIVANGGRIYDLPDAVVMRGIKRLLEFRNEVMHKGVQHYRQTADTCASAGLMMMLHRLLGTPLTPQTEREIHTEARSTLSMGAHFSMLARIAVRLGLEVSLLHSDPEMFVNGGHFTPQVFDALLREYRSALPAKHERRFEVKSGVAVSSKEVRRLLQDDYLVLCAGMRDSILHAVVANGYNQEGILVNDPLADRVSTMSDGRLDGFMETPIGRWMLAVRHNQEALRRLLRQLPIFREQANGYLK